MQLDLKCKNTNNLSLSRNKSLLVLLIGVVLTFISCQWGKKDREFLLPFTKVDSLNPIMMPDKRQSFVCPVRGTSVAWEAKDVFNPAAVVKGDTVFLLYRAEDTIGKFAGTSRIGLAWSLDGLRFTKYPAPVLYPDKDSCYRWEWEGGCEDPRIIQSEQGEYILTYTAYDGDKARLMVARSRDLRNWIKEGPAFAKALEGKYLNHWSKSGAIIARYEGSAILAQKVLGKYWMYWGDTDIFLAWSDDLIHWTPMEKKDGTLQSVFGPRKGMFDSDLVEPGPAALYTGQGILLLYNSRNVPSKGDPWLLEGTYAASQILLDRDDPATVVERMNTMFLRPDKPYEKIGQVNEVCFIEGLVMFQKKWFLYYGTADSRIAVAVK